jgi:hypothetical protein
MARLEASEASTHEGLVTKREALPLWLDGQVAGSVSRGHEDDDALTANVLLENLTAKATGVFALRTLMNQVGDRPGWAGHRLCDSRVSDGRH